MNSETDVSTDTGLRLQALLRSSLTWIVAIFMAIALTGILSFDFVSSPTVSVTLGEAAPQDVIAPRSLTYVSEVATQQQREQAANSVPTVYASPDLSIIGRAQRNQAQAMFNFMDVVRADPLADNATKLAYLQAIDGLTIEPQVAADILSFSAADFTVVKDDVLRIIEQAMRQEIREGQVSEARRVARRQFSFFLTTPQERVVTALAPQFVLANTFPDEEATARRRAEAVAQVQPVTRSVSQGQLVIRLGDVVDAEDIELLEVLGLRQPGTDWRQLVSVFAAVMLGVVLVVLYWQQYEGKSRYSWRHLVLFAAVVLVFAVGAKVMVPGRNVSAYLFPAAAMSMLVAVLFDARLSLLTTIVMATLVGYIAGNALELTMYTAIGGMLAVLMLRDMQRVNAFFRAGLLAALANIAVVVVFHLPQQALPLEVFRLMGLGLANGLLAAGLTLVGLYIAGSLFGVVTTMQLQELSRLDHPLLQELLRRAPGTYHHSIWVANLAEQAADQVNANAALVRVGAFYHDVGKMNRPPFFTENQGAVNPHDSLDPYSSARIIISHVADGLELARQYRLPDRLRDFIAEHHGDGLIRAFLAKAVELAGDDAARVDEARFRYPGPKPRSRETGIVMLSDSVEATSRALQPDTEKAIEKLVAMVFETLLGDGQLDNSGLTLGDIKTIRTSFIKALKGRFHVRVKYPENARYLAEVEAEALEAGDTAPALPAGQPAVTSELQPVAPGLHEG